MTFDILKQRAQTAKARSILELFSDPERPVAFSAALGELVFDFSKTTLIEEDLSFLIGMAEAAGVAERRQAMFDGAPINETEGRAVLHTALRKRDGGPVFVGGRDVMPGVHATLTRMAAFSDTVRSGAFKGQGGPITDVINIGIGGSDLGPVMTTRALTPFHDGPRVHFVSNVDGADAADTFKGLNPATTLVIVASKTFTTVETMTNAETARLWMARKVTRPGDQFVALSSATDKTGAFGIPESQVFGFEDWVGGRYSIWGPIGLPLMLAIGPERFDEFLNGGFEMDCHFREAPVRQNLPMLLAFIGIWHHQGCGFATRAILPYDQRLSRLPAYFQQLEMESNGKRVTLGGQDLAVPSGPIVWGEPGTNGQHAFYQLIHQGTDVVPCDFILAARGHEPELQHHHDLLVANCLAQSEALMRGRSLHEVRARMAAEGSPPGDELEQQARHRVFPGNRPSTTLIFPQLTPYILGQIVALYEHRVFVEGVMLGINSYDQWGVELGKELATTLGPVVTGEVGAETRDGSTKALVAYLLKHRR